MKVKTEERRVAIVEAAAQVFLEMGYEGTSMNEITKRLGGSKTTLYGYFGSKQELFAAVVHEYAIGHLDDAANVLNASFKDLKSFRQVMCRFAETVLAVLANDREALAFYRLVVGESGRSAVGQVFHDAGPQQCLEAVAEQCRKAMTMGLLREADADVRALQLLALITAQCDCRVFQMNPPALAKPQIAALAAEAVNFFTRGASLAEVE